MKKKNLIIIVAVIMVLIILVALLFANKSSTPKETDTTESYTEQETRTGIALPYYMQNSCKITRIFPYTGPFVEDGSDSHCENAFAVIIENTTDKDIQLVSFTLTTATDTYTFKVTTLLQNHSVTVIEQEGKSFTNEDIIEVNITEEVLFTEKPSDCRDILEVTPLQSLINVKNLTDKDITNAYFYYKNMSEDGSWLGGITYRVSMNDLLKSGELRQLAAGHFGENSRILFVTYAN